MRTVLVFVAILLAISASADLIDLGDITRDTDTGLDWLDLSESTSLSYDDIVNGIGNTLVAEGWRHATGGEVCELLATHAFAPAPCPRIGSASQPGDVAPELRALLGILFVSANIEGTSGYYDDGDTVVSVGRMQLNFSILFDETIVIVQDDAALRTDSIGTVGNLLVRPFEREIIIDDFEVGAFGPLTDATTEDGPELLVQSGLDPSHVVAGRRQIQVELSPGSAAGSSVTASLMTNGADDGIVFDVPANAGGFFDVVSFFLSADFDFTANGSTELVVTAPGLPFLITVQAWFVHGPSGESASLSQFSTAPAADTYVFPFEDFVWSGAEGSFDAVSRFTLSIRTQFTTESPRSLIVTDIRTVPEPSNELLIVAGLVALGALRQQRASVRV